MSLNAPEQSRSPLKFPETAGEEGEEGGVVYEHCRRKVKGQMQSVKHLADGDGPGAPRWGPSHLLCPGFDPERGAGSQSALQHTVFLVCPCLASSLLLPTDLDQSFSELACKVEPAAEASGTLV